MHKNIPEIPASQRLIFACDVPTVEEAKSLVNELDESVEFYKIGLELLMSKGFFGFMEWLKEQGKKVFVDVKFFDVPNTVGSAIRQLSKYGADFATVHGDDSIMKAAADNKGEELKVLAVTVLTSLDGGDLKDFESVDDVEQLVLSRAERARKLGCDGVISSGLEAKGLRLQNNNANKELIIVCPGIRPLNHARNDQKRTVTVTQAFENGADYIVVGRPIRQPEKGSRKEAAESIQKEIRDFFSLSPA